MALFPARAGVIPFGMGLWTFSRAFPRACGGDPSGPLASSS